MDENDSNEFATSAILHWNRALARKSHLAETCGIEFLFLVQFAKIISLNLLTVFSLSTSERPKDVKQNAHIESR